MRESTRPRAGRNTIAFESATPRKPDRQTNDVAHADVSGLDAPTALARKREVEARLAFTRGEPGAAAERELLKAENDALGRRLGEINAPKKLEKKKRYSAGLMSPLWKAVAARFDPATVLELECDALKRLAEREERRASAKTAPNNGVLP